MSTNLVTGKTSFLIAEAGIAILILLIPFALPGLAMNLFRPIEKWAGRLAKRKRLAVLRTLKQSLDWLLRDQHKVALLFEAPEGHPYRW